MLAHVLCPGPSLASYRGDGAPALTIGINRAALRFACDWWAACDYPMIRDKAAQVAGNPGLLSKRQTVADLRPPRLARFPAIAYVEDLAGPDGIPWRDKTLTCAMVSAAACGATRIELHGCDWAADAPDWDGVQAGEDRSAHRFAREREDVGALVAWLAERGVAVERKNQRFIIASDSAASHNDE